MKKLHSYFGSALDGDFYYDNDRVAYRYEGNTGRYYRKTSFRESLYIHPLYLTPEQYLGTLHNLTFDEWCTFCFYLALKHGKIGKPSWGG